MLDTLLIRHLALDVLRIVIAALLVASCLPLGRWVRRAWGGREEPMFDLGVGFAVSAAVLRCLAWLGWAKPATVLIWSAAAMLPLFFYVKERQQSCRTPDWALLIALPALIMAVAPPASFDELAYHLRIPEVTLHIGSWPLDPANSATFYPGATEALYLPALALDPSGIVAKLIHFAFFVLLLVVVGRLGGRWAVLLVGTIPALAIAGGWALADAPLLVLLACAALAIRDGDFADAFALLGAAAAVKYSALLFGLPLAVLAFRRSAWRGAVAGVLVAAPWYLGHPLALSAANLEWGGSWLAYFTRPEGLDNDIGGVLFFGALFAALLAGKRAWIVAAMVALALPFHPAGRVLLPVVVAVMIVAAPRLRWLSVIFILRGLGVVAGHNALFFNPTPVAAGLESEETYLQRNAPFVPFYRTLALPPGTNVLVVGEPRLFGFPARTSGAGLPDPPALRPFVAMGGDLSGQLRAAGYTHLLVNFDSLNGKTTMQAHRRDTALTDGERRALEELMHRSQRVARMQNMVLLKLN